jgi:hypothetical protein
MRHGKNSVRRSRQLRGDGFLPQDIGVSGTVGMPRPSNNRSNFRRPAAIIAVAPLSLASRRGLSK